MIIGTLISSDSKLQKVYRKFQISKCCISGITVMNVGI